MRLSRKLRERFYYSIPVAGAHVGWSRSESYRAANRGDIPNERDGKFRLVPRRMWDAKVRRLRQGPRIKSRRSHRSAAAEASTT
jgi:hypothetical protein